MRQVHGLRSFRGDLVALSAFTIPDIGLVNFLSTFRHNSDTK